MVTASSIAVASAVVSCVAAAALTGEVRPVHLSVFAISSGGSALAAALITPRVGRRWPLAMIVVPLAFLVASAWLWVSAAYFRWSVGPYVLVDPDEGMTLAAASWLPAVLVGAAVYSAARESRDDAPASSEPGGATARALASALVVLPFILQGVPSVVAPRLMNLFAVPTCNGTAMLERMVDVDVAVQWIPSAPYDGADWNESQTVAMINGQVVTPLQVPPLLPKGMYFHKRYLAAGARAVDSGETGTTFIGEYRNVLLRAITLGASPLPITDVRAEIDLCAFL